MGNTQWWDYVQTVAGDVQAKEIADRAGFDKSAITRWKQGANPDPLFVVKFARAYSRPVGEALAASGLITPEESNVTTVSVGIEDALAEASSDAILVELRRRLVGAEAHNVTELPTIGRAKEHSLRSGRIAAKRGKDQAATPSAD